jgi:hypothetical protein
MRCASYWSVSGRDGTTGTASTTRTPRSGSASMKLWPPFPLAVAVSASFAGVVFARREES